MFVKDKIDAAMDRYFDLGVKEGKKEVEQRIADWIESFLCDCCQEQSFTKAEIRFLVNKIRKGEYE